MRFFVIALVVLACTALFAGRLSRDRLPGAAIVEPAAAIASPTPIATVRKRPPQAVDAAVGVAGEIVRATDSHFYVDAQVNGARVKMLIDTGASSVVLTRADAQAAGIPAAAGEFTARGIGVGGEIALKPVRINRLAIGSLAANNVSAMVAEGALPVSLLGQSYLERVGSVEIRGDRMILR